MRFLILVLTFVLAACVPSTPGTPQPPTLAWLHLHIADAANRGIGDALATCEGLPAVRTNVNGDASLQLTRGTSCTLSVTATHWKPGAAVIPVERDTDFSLRLDRDPPREPTKAEILEYRGYLANLRDFQDRIMWTPSLHGVPADIRAEWLQGYASAGATHIPIGPFDAGEAYPGAGFDGPDLNDNPTAIRALLDEIRDTRTLRGHGLIPVIFLDGGGRNPAPRLARIIPTLSTALEGIGTSTITLPCGWESYEWTAKECGDAVRTWQPLSQGSVLAWHPWPGRSNGASWPPQPDDPWGSDGARFWRETPFEMFFAQIAPPRTMEQADCHRTVWYVDPNTGKSGWTYPEDCWMNRFEDNLARVGASTCNDAFGDRTPCAQWPTRVFVAFETTTYWEFRKVPGIQAVTHRVNDRIKALCESYAVNCGFGTGWPLPLDRP